MCREGSVCVGWQVRQMDEQARQIAELQEHAAQNRRVFDQVLAGYVRMKLAQVMPRMGKQGWFDASGCVWCLFDDERFVRSGSAARELREQGQQGFDLQVYWSIEDVVMPSGCDERWVAVQIVHEAVRQLGEQGYRSAVEERTVEGERHLGVRFHRGLLAGLWGS